MDKKFNDDLDALLEEASEVSGTSEISDNKTIAKSSEKISYEIKDTDDFAIIALKNYINTAGITAQDIYDIKGQRDAYNMIYSLKKSQLGLGRLEEWCKILHINPILTFMPMTDEEMKASDKELMNNSKKLKKGKKK